MNETVTSLPSEISIPVRLDEIADEVARHTSLSLAEARDRVERDFAAMGWTVQQDVQRFGVTPHFYDENMERLYRESHGFIFATMVFWARPKRQLWIERAAQRIRLYAQQRGIKPDEVSILMFGDGSGNDTLYLVREGFRVQWFEMPGSKVYDFALGRFRRKSLIPDRIRPLSDYRHVLEGKYDVVLCFEVLEHLPDPDATIADMAKVLKNGGLALITEAFRAMGSNHPTHLISNAKFEGRTPFMFLKHGLKLRWCSSKPTMKPMEFVKAETTSLIDTLRLFARFQVLRRWIAGRVRNCRRRDRPVTRSADQ